MRESGRFMSWNNFSPILSLARFIYLYLYIFKRQHKTVFVCTACHVTDIDKCVWSSSVNYRKNFAKLSKYPKKTHMTNKKKKTTSIRENSFFFLLNRQKRLALILYLCKSGYGPLKRVFAVNISCLHAKLAVPGSKQLSDTSSSLYAVLFSLSLGFWSRPHVIRNIILYTRYTYNCATHCCNVCTIPTYILYACTYTRILTTTVAVPCKIMTIIRTYI